MYEEDTIAAIATPPGEGGVAIVRVSGPHAERIGGTIFRQRSNGNGSFQSHKLYHGTICQPASGAILDDVLATVMHRPHSYTGEDVLEIHCHGGSYVARQVLETVLRCGARHAEPGEFTKRAYLNGRLDLAQAEGILDLIHSRTEQGLGLAVEQVRGRLSKWVTDLREELTNIMVQVEAAIDFPEEELELLKRDELALKIDALTNKISMIINSYAWGKMIREGIRVCIVGRPNVGKSSLFNALLEEDRVIVAPAPGTTRDYIEEALDLAGLKIVLWDTAGIRKGENKVEMTGVSLSLQKLNEAQGIILVLDGAAEVSPGDHEIISKVKGKKGIVVVNKTDLPPRVVDKELEQISPFPDIVRISATTGEGISELKNRIRKCFLGAEPESDMVLTNVRHKTALEIAVSNLLEASNSLRNKLPAEMVAVDLQGANQSLGEIIGVVTNEDLLDRIFSQFCIGK